MSCHLGAAATHAVHMRWLCDDCGYSWVKSMCEADEELGYADIADLMTPLPGGMSEPCEGWPPMVKIKSFRPGEDDISSSARDGLSRLFGGDIE